MDVCDFCSSPDVVTRFACRDFESASGEVGVFYANTRMGPEPTNLIVASKSYWAACEACKAQVEARDLDALVEYVLSRFEKRDGFRFSRARRRQLRRHLGQTYARFFQNRIEN